MRRNELRQAGFTLIELAFVVFLAAIFATLAVPSFQDSIVRNAIISENGRMMTMLNYIRSTAISTSQTITVRSISGNTDWRDGWQVFIDTDADGVLDAGEVLLSTANRGSVGRSTLTGPAAFIRFTNVGRLNAAAANLFLVCDSQKQVEGRVITINLMGRATWREDSAGVCPAP